MGDYLDPDFLGWSRFQKDGAVSFLLPSANGKRRPLHGRCYVVVVVVVVDDDDDAAAAPSCFPVVREPCLHFEFCNLSKYSEDLRKKSELVLAINE